VLIQLSYCILRSKEFPFLKTKSRWTSVGTRNGFFPEALGELLHQELEKHDMYLQANKDKNEQFMGDSFPPLALNLRLPESKDL